MGKRTALFAVALLGACTASRTHAPVDAGSAEVQPNDNRIAAGRLRDGVLTLELAIGSGTWYAERALPPYHVLAFAEGHGPLQTPGPLIRVRVGTTVAVTLVNRTDAELSVHGLGRRDESASPARATTRTMCRARRPSSTRS